MHNAVAGVPLPARYVRVRVSFTGPLCMWVKSAARIPDAGSDAPRYKLYETRVRLAINARLSFTRVAIGQARAPADIETRC